MVGKDCKTTTIFEQLRHTVQKIVSLGFTNMDRMGPDWGITENPCWPKDLVPDDPGYAVLTWDPYYGGGLPPYDYKTSVTKTPMDKRLGATKRGLPVGMEVAMPRTTLVAETVSQTTTRAEGDVAVTSMPEPTEMPGCDDDCGEWEEWEK